MVRTAVRAIQALAIAALVAAVACGGGNNGPSEPSPGPGGGNAPSGATITIGANGAVSPAQVTINTGQSVTFVNSSNRTRNVSSDPHPIHTDCPAFASVGLLEPGQTKQTSGFTIARTCGFHDHDDPDNAALKGSVVIR